MTGHAPCTAPAVSVHASGNLAIDRIRWYTDSATPVVGFAPLHACAFEHGGAAGCVEPRAIEDVCDLSLRPGDPCDTLDPPARPTAATPTPGEGYGGPDAAADATDTASKESRTYGLIPGNVAAALADTSVGGMLDVFA